MKSLLARPFWLWSTSDVSPWQTGLFHRAVQVVHILVTVLVAVGIVRARSDLRAFWPFWILAGYQTALHLIYHVEPRFTLEARVFMIGFTSYLFSPASPLRGAKGAVPRGVAGSGRSGW